MRTRDIVRRHCHPSYDVESIAMDILIDSWSSGLTQPSVDFIRQRCIDAGRRRQVENHMLRDKANEPEAGISPGRIADHVAEKEQVNKLMKCLNIFERKVIYYLYFADYDLKETAKALRADINVVRETRTQALFKMREEGWE